MNYGNTHLSKKNRPAYIPLTSNIIAVGDFNVHHPQWGGDEIPPDADADQLLAVIDEFGLMQHVPRGSSTFQSSVSSPQTLDLMFTTEGLRERVTQCGVAYDFDHGSDHYPVTLDIDISIADGAQEAIYNLGQINKAIFINELNKLPPRLPDIGIANEPTLNLVSGLIRDNINQALIASTPKRDPKAPRVPGFNQEYKDAIATTQKRRRLYQKLRARLSPDSKRLDKARKRWKDAVKQGKSAVASVLREEHRERLQQSIGDIRKVWRVATWAKNRDTPFKPFSTLLRHPDGTRAANKAESA